MSDHIHFVATSLCLLRFLSKSREGTSSILSLCIVRRAMLAWHRSYFSRRERYNSLIHQRISTLQCIYLLTLDRISDLMKCSESNFRHIFFDIRFMLALGCVEITHEPYLPLLCSNVLRRKWKNHTGSLWRWLVTSLWRYTRTNSKHQNWKPVAAHLQAKTWLQK